MFRVRSCVIGRSRRLNRKEPPLKTGLAASVQSFEFSRHPAMSGSRERQRVVLRSRSCERKRVVLCSCSCERKRVVLCSCSCERKRVVRIACVAASVSEWPPPRLCLAQSHIGAKRSGSLRRLSLVFPKTPEAGRQGYQNDVNDSWLGDTSILDRARNA
jgi:hypothetical protein